MSGALKAYVVQDESDAHAEVVFARLNAAARRIGANKLDSDFHSVTCRRAPEFDHCSPGPVPFTTLFEYGWWRECDGCGVRIEDGAYDDDGNVIDFDIVEEAAAVYCTPACRVRHVAEHARVKRAEVRAIKVMQARLLREHPGVTVIGGDEAGRYTRPNAYVSRDKAGRLRIRQVVVHFDFPGRRHGFGSFRAERDQSHLDRKPALFVPFGDKRAFEAWRKAGSLRLTALQRLLLAAWVGMGEEFGCLTFNAIARRSGVDRRLVRRGIRALARKGVTEYHRGLWTDEGEPAGSGYGLTPLGWAALDLQQITAEQGDSSC